MRHVGVSKVKSVYGHLTLVAPVVKSMLTFRTEYWQVQQEKKNVVDRSDTCLMNKLGDVLRVYLFHYQIVHSKSLIIYQL